MPVKDFTEILGTGSPSPTEVILPETHLSEAMIVAERIKRAVAALPLKRKVTVSIGIAKCATHNTNRYELIQRADLALSKAKKEGRNLVYSFG